MDIEATQKKPSNKTPLFVLLTLALLVLAAAALWYFILRDQPKTNSVVEKKVATTAAQPTPTTKDTTTSEPVVDDTALITKALVAKTGIAADVIDVTVSTKTEKLAKGLVSAKGEEVGGGYFLAAKVNDN